MPSAAGVWALGDCAAVPNAHDGKVSPPTAQFAERQALSMASSDPAFAALAAALPVADVGGLPVADFVKGLASAARQVADDKRLRLEHLDFRMAPADFPGEPLARIRIAVPEDHDPR